MPSLYGSTGDVCSGSSVKQQKNSFFRSALREAGTAACSSDE